MPTHPLTLVAPEGAPKGCIQILHGMAEHMARYERMANALAARGYVVAGRDHRGHGAYCEKDKLGFFAEQDGWQVILQDAKDTRDELAARYPGVPFILLGHSMGSFLAREYALQHPGDLSALVLSGTGWYPRLICALGALAARFSPQSKPAPLVDKLAFSSNNKSFAPARTPFDWLSRDEAEVDKYIQDPLCGFIFTGSAYRDFFGGLSRLTKKSRLLSLPKDLPVYLMSGACDPVGQMGKGVETVAAQYRAAGVRSVTVKLYEGARHELFNETNRDAVLDDLAAWLDEHVGRQTL